MDNNTIFVGIIYSSDISNNKIYIVSDSEEGLSFPQINLSTINFDLEEIGIEWLMKKLYNKYINIDPNWLDSRLVHIELKKLDNRITTIIYYGVCVPLEIPLKNGNWIDVSEFIPVYETLRKLICMI